VSMPDMFYHVPRLNKVVFRKYEMDDGILEEIPHVVHPALFPVFTKKEYFMHQHYNSMSKMRQSRSLPRDTIFSLL